MKLVLAVVVAVYVVACSGGLLDASRNAEPRPGNDHDQHEQRSGGWSAGLTTGEGADPAVHAAPCNRHVEHLEITTFEPIPIQVPIFPETGRSERIIGWKIKV